MVTYGIALAFTFSYLAFYPATVKWAIAGGAFLTTALIPALFILLLMKSGAASNMALTERKERALPYLIFTTSLTVCVYYLYKMRMPFWLLAVGIGACVALVVATCINFYWKISAHSIGTGGLLGGIMGISRLHLSNPYGGFILFILIAGFVAASRIYLKQHTPMQTYAGFALGFVCVFGAVSLSYFYLLI